MLSMHSRRPNTPGLSCLPLILLLSGLLSACGGSGTNTMSYTVGGTVTGLSASGLGLGTKAMFTGSWKPLATTSTS